MADDPINQAQFDADVAAAAEAGGEAGFMNPADPNAGFNMPSVDEVWKIIESMEGISDEERENLRASLYNPQDGSPEDFFKRLGAEQPAMGHTSWDYLIFFSMITIVLLIFALFGYKLYKSLTEKELKKQEKQKIKQTKKSKKVN